jgi:signal transduction histidine kinase
MFDTIQQISLAAALVIDTVLLAALLERRNWPFVRVPIVAMLFGAWLWHGGQFALLLAVGLPGTWAWHVQGMCMLAMAAGLLLIPCGLLHGTWRVWQDKLEAQAHSRARHGLAYLPMIGLVPLDFWFFAPERAGFDAVTRPLELPYFLFSALVNVVAAAVFVKVRPRLDMPHARLFFLLMAFVLVGMTALQGSAFVVVQPGARPYIKLAVALSPLLPALLFAYFVIRYHFLQIIVGRSLVYGTILGSILLLHQLAFQDVSAALPEGLRLHVVFLEAVVLGIFVLAYQPLRQRTAEGLRYFLGARVSAIRERLHRLSGELSAQATRSPRDMLFWFADSLRDCLQVEYVAGWLFDDAGAIDFRFGQTEHWSDQRAAWLFQHMRKANVPMCSHRRERDREVLHVLQATAASFAVVKTRPHVTGLLIVGRGLNNRDLSDEETNAVLLLIEQLAITLDNSLLQAMQMAAERKALQDEKLAALGLLASSIAHEVKNPLSAIKTIATVMAEDLGPHSPHAEDLCLILAEIERLATVTSQLLATARTRGGPGAPASVPDALTGTLRLLRHLAGQKEIVIETHLADDLPLVQADEHTLREIFLNLLSNSLEAAGIGGHVAIHCRRIDGFVVAEVSDSGPGMDEEARTRLFEPFFTTKRAGTGLGLYAVGRHVGALGGAIQCDSRPGEGTSFTIKLPYQDYHDP